MDYKFGFKFASKAVEKYLDAEFKRNVDQFDSWEPKRVGWSSVKTREKEITGFSRPKFRHFFAGSAPNYKAAFEEISNHIEKDGLDEQSLLWLARMYVMGDGVEQDLGSACALICKAAEHGK